MIDANFHYFDKNGDGSIEKEELGPLLTNMQVPVSPEQIAQTFALVYIIPISIYQLYFIIIKTSLNSQNHIYMYVYAMHV